MALEFHVMSLKTCYPDFVKLIFTTIYDFLSLCQSKQADKMSQLPLECAFTTLKIQNSLLLHQQDHFCPPSPGEQLPLNHLSPTETAAETVSLVLAHS